MVFTIHGRGGHLGHVSWISRSNFRLPYPWMLHIKFHFDWPSSFREEDLQKSVYGQQTGEGQEMTLTYINHIPSSTPLVVCIYHFSRPQAAIVFKKSIVFTFSYVKAYVSKFDLAVK